MKISRSSRFFAAFFVIFSMLFMQIAIASYVCPSVAMGNDTGALTAVEKSVDTSNMSNCVGMDKVQPSLCYAYTQDQQSKQSLDKTQLPDVQPFTSAGILFALLSFDFNAQSSFGPPTRPFQIRPDSPPITILYCCFRI